MNRIRSIQFKDHPVLGNLFLDFCDPNGNPVDTVIIAGENGTGKSTVLDALYSFAFGGPDYCGEIDLIYENKNVSLTLDYENMGVSGRQELMLSDHQDTHTFAAGFKDNSPYKVSVIYSRAAINFRSEKVVQVGSKCLDENKDSRCSDENLATEIAHLLVDIDAQDNADVVQEYEKRQMANLPTEGILTHPRLSRFTRAFQSIFDDLMFERIDTRDGGKEILFSKGKNLFSLEGLSSGEKQIVYRGSFLLEDVNSLRGAFVLIDEPEISLHPSWQEKIMDYYKGIFTDEKGNQTSQIFVVTHSPFIIHNKNRTDDKVIILKRDADGRIVVSDKQEYYKCTSVEAAQDAFGLASFLASMSEDRLAVYLEGSTDELYFRKATEVYNLKLPFAFENIGIVDERGQDKKSGKDNLKKFEEAVIRRKLPFKTVCLYDWDAKVDARLENNVYICSLPKYDNTKGMKKGIENALVLDDINMTRFYTLSDEVDYGEIKYKFEKKLFCKYICEELDIESQKKVFVHLKEMIEELLQFFER